MPGAACRSVSWGGRSDRGVDGLSAGPAGDDSVLVERSISCERGENSSGYALECTRGGVAAGRSSSVSRVHRPLEVEAALLRSMGNLTITLSRHAVVRFQERARPGLDILAAEEELARLVSDATVLSTPPAWLHPGTKADLYLLIADLVLPLLRMRCGPDAYLATTCIARGGFSQPSRRRHSAAKRRTRPARAGRDRRLAHVRDYKSLREEPWAA